jgi:hypothetical protein
MNGWTRCTKSNPCPICGKPDWCMIGIRGVLCMRQGDGYSIQLSDGSTGWFHPFDRDATAPRKPLPARAERSNLPRPNFLAMIKAWSQETQPHQIHELATALGVTTWSLGSLGACWSGTHKAWAFPMSDEWGAIIGIRLRYPNGEKRAVLGSRNGLFVPEMDTERRLFVCEGPSDTAAAISLGLWAVGRPSCSACGPMLSTFIARRRVKEAVVLADADKPGISGAERLALPCPFTIMLPPAAKDVRESLRLGCTRELIETSLYSQVWTQP